MVDTIICCNSTKCLRLKNTYVKKGKTYFYDKNRMKENGEIFVYYKPFNYYNPKWGYLGIFNIKDFITESQSRTYKLREEKLNKILECIN